MFIDEGLSKFQEQHRLRELDKLSITPPVKKWTLNLLYRGQNIQYSAIPNTDGYETAMPQNLIKPKIVVIKAIEIRQNRKFVRLIILSQKNYKLPDFCPISGDGVLNRGILLCLY